MELEELKKSWNALDEHLKDKELIKEEELGKLIGLIPAGSPVAWQTEPNLYYHHSVVDSRTLLGHHYYTFSTTNESR